MITRSGTSVTFLGGCGQVGSSFGPGGHFRGDYGVGHKGHASNRWCGGPCLGADAARCRCTEAASASSGIGRCNAHKIAQTLKSCERLGGHAWWGRTIPQRQARGTFFTLARPPQARHSLPQARLKFGHSPFRCAILMQPRARAGPAGVRPRLTRPGPHPRPTAQLSSRCSTGGFAGFYCAVFHAWDPT
jgi:hypothetical protein